MTITIDLPMEIESRLAEEAKDANISQELLVSQLIAMYLPPTEKSTGAEVVAYWKQIGLIGMWAGREDMKDSTAWVQRQRGNRSEQSRQMLRELK